MVFIVDPAIVNLINVMVPVVILGTNLIYHITLISINNRHESHLPHHSHFDKQYHYYFKESNIVALTLFLAVWVGFAP